MNDAEIIRRPSASRPGERWFASTDRMQLVRELREIDRQVLFGEHTRLLARAFGIQLPFEPGPAGPPWIETADMSERLCRKLGIEPSLPADATWQERNLANCKAIMCHLNSRADQDSIAREEDGGSRV